MRRRRRGRRRKDGEGVNAFQTIYGNEKREKAHRREIIQCGIGKFL